MGIFVLDKIQKLLQRHIAKERVNVRTVIEGFRVRTFPVHFKFTRIGNTVIFINVTKIIKPVSPFIGIANLSDGVDIDILSVYFLGTCLYFILHQQNVVGTDTRVAVIFFVKQDRSGNPDCIFLIRAGLKTALHITHKGVICLFQFRFLAADGFGQLRLKL